MSNPKIRSLGRRGGQKTSADNGEAKKKEGSYGYRVDDETRDIVKSLFEEYASDDGKNFYSGNKDEKAEKEHEEFINEVDKQLNGDSEESGVSDVPEEPVSETEIETSPLSSLLKNDSEKADDEKAEAPEEKENVEEAAAAVEEAPVKAKREPAKIKEKRISILKKPKKAEEAPAEKSEETVEKPEEEKPKAKSDKKEKNKTKRKAAGKMKKKTTPKDEEFYDEYDDGYEEYDDYENEYSEDYDDDGAYEDDYDDEEEYEPKRSGGGVEFSLKIVSLTIVLVVVLLIMTALFINNRSLNAELQEAYDNYDQVLSQYTSQVEQLNAKIAELTNPQGESTDSTAAEGAADSSSAEGEASSESGEENYYVVQSGDTLYKIASSELGDPNLYYLIQEANNMGSTTSLSVGDKLIIPNVE